jgi:hypothetical protein
MHPVLIRGLAVVADWKRQFLLGVFVLAAILGILAQSRRLESWLPVFAVTMGLIVLMLVLSLLATRHYHPAVLFVRPRPPAFAAAADLSRVFTAAAFILLGGGLVGENVADIVNGEEFWYIEAGTAVLIVLAVALHLYVAPVSAWRRQACATGSRSAPSSSRGRPSRPAIRRYRSTPPSSPCTTSGRT